MRKASKFRQLEMQQLEVRNVLAPLLPDLFAWADQGRGYLYDYVVEGDLLRFTTALANNGDGPLEIRGGDPLPNGRQEVYQRIFDSDGGFTDRLAGEFTYHPSHGHIHFDGYAIYNLREKLSDDSVGDVVASGGKVSFCLIDIAKYDPSAGPSQYGSCGATRQGITNGWSDVYSRFLSDQWINISTVADGEYWLEVVVDPDDQLVESDETNNSEYITVTLNRGGTAGGDRYESNDNFATATNLGPVSRRSEPGLSIHTASDEDFYQFNIAESGDFEVSLYFTNDLGNLDLYLFDAAQNLVLSSTGDSDVQELLWSAAAGETYYVQVVGVGGDTNAYDLEFYGPGAQETFTILSADANLPVNIPDGVGASSPGATVTSTLEGPDLILSDLNLIIDNLQHSWLGDLHIDLVSPAGTAVTIFNSEFENPPGIFDGLGGPNNLVGTFLDDQAPMNLATGSAPFTGSFNINHPSVGSSPLAAFNGENALGTWEIRVTDWYSADSGELYDWSIQFTGVPSIAPDRFEQNDAFPQAHDLGPLGDAHEDELSIHTSVDRDFFRFTSAATGMAGIDVLFSHDEGDLELVVYDSNLTEIGRSATADDNESLSLAVALNELYYIEVFGDSGATNSAYTLNVSGATALPGDFNGDGVVDTTDIDLICAGIQSGVHDPVYDLTGDGLVNAADGEELVYNVMGLLPGDGNADGRVDVGDFNLWNTHKFQPGCWTSGDFNFSGYADVADFNIWNANKFTANTVLSAQPAEPPVGFAQTAASTPVVESARAAFGEAGGDANRSPRVDSAASDALISRRGAAGRRSSWNDLVATDGLGKYAARADEVFAVLESR